MDIPWANIGEFLKAAVPVLIAAIVAWVAIQNWLTAKDKLALDLFDRRFKAWTDVEHCFQNALIEAERIYLRGDDIEISNSTLIDFSRIESNAHWLFGEDVRRQIATVAHVVVAMTGEHAEDDYDSPHRTREAQFNHEISRPTVVALGKLRRMVEPYMMMGHIAVNRPAKRLRWPWQRRR